jgi:hypothetical protein
MIILYHGCKLIQQLMPFKALLSPTYCATPSSRAAAVVDAFGTSDRTRNAGGGIMEVEIEGDEGSMQRQANNIKAHR